MARDSTRTPVCRQRTTPTPTSRCSLRPDPDPSIVVFMGIVIPITAQHVTFRKQKVLNKVQLTNCWLGSSFPTGRRTRRTCPSTFPWTHQHFQPIRIKCHVYTFIKISIYQPMVYIYIIFSNLLNWFVSVLSSWLLTDLSSTDIKIYLENIFTYKANANVRWLTKV